MSGRLLKYGLAVVLGLLLLLAPFIYQNFDFRALPKSLKPADLIKPINPSGLIITAPGIGSYVGEIFFYNYDSFQPVYDISRSRHLAGLYLRQTNSRKVQTDFFAAFKASSEKLGSIELISGEDGKTLKEWTVPAEVKTISRIVSSFDIDEDHIADFYGLSEGRIYRGSSARSKILEIHGTASGGDIRDILPAKDLNDDGLEEVLAIREQVKDKTTFQSLSFMDLKNETVLGLAALDPRRGIPNDLTLGDLGEYNNNRFPDLATSYYNNGKLHESVISGQKILKGNIDFTFDRASEGYAHAAYKFCDLNRDGKLNLIILEYGGRDQIHIMVFDNVGNNSELIVERLYDLESHRADGKSEFNLFDCADDIKSKTKGIVFGDPLYADVKNNRYGRVLILDSRTLEVQKSFFGSNPNEQFGHDIFLLHKNQK